MAKRQKLIHLHSSGVTNVLKAEDLFKGEIAVRHATEKPELYIRKEDDTLATFIDEKAISKKITDVTDVISSNLEALSGATEALVGTVVGGYVTSESLEETLEGVTKGINATIGTLSGRVDGHDEKFVKLEKDFDDYKESVGKTYVTKSEYSTHEGAFNAYTAATDKAIEDITKDGGAIDSAITSAATFASAYTNAEIAKVNSLIDTEKARINELEESAATKVELVAVSGVLESTFNAKINDITKDGGAIDSAITSAATFASAYTNAEIAKVNKLIDTEKARIDVLEESAATKVELGAQSGRIDTLATEVNTIKTTTIPNAKDAAILSAATFASAYTNAEIAKVKSDVIAPLDTKLTTLIGDDSGKTARAIAEDVVKFVVSGASGAFDTLKEVEDWIAKDEKGTADLIQTVTGLGVIANFASGHTVDLEKEFDEFKESVGKTYATKVELGAQSGRIDTLATEVNTIKTTTIPNAKDAAIKAATEASSAYTNAEIAKVQKDVDANASEISNLWTSAATKVELGTQSGRIDTLVTEVNTIKTTTIPNAKDAAILSAATFASAYTNAEIAKVKDVEIAGLDVRIDALEALSGTTNNAVQSASILNTGVNKITVEKKGTNLEFNFDELVIDCGEF